MVKGHRALAIAVLRLAIRDAAGIIEEGGYSTRGTSTRGRKSPQGRPSSKAEAQADARAWLTEYSESLAFWCDLAEVEVSTVLDGAEGAITRIWIKSRAKRS